MAFADFLPAFRRPEARMEHVLMPLQRQIDRLFEDFWSAGTPALLDRSSTFMPRVDIAESDKDIKVTAELPGLDEGDVEVILDKRLLTLRGEKRSESEEHERGRTYIERACGSFERQIPLGSEIDEAKVEAAFHRGVLSITLPKTEEARSRSHKIKIQSGGAAKESRPKGGLFKSRNGGQEAAAQE